MEFSIIPRFNTDRKFYTPAFFNPFEGLGNERDSRMKYILMRQTIAS